MLFRKATFIIALFLLFLSNCLVMENKFSSVAPGPWRGVLQIEPKFISPNKKGQPLPEKMNLKFDEVYGGELPFIFDVVYDNEIDFHIEIINGEERIRVDDVSIGHNLATGKDTILINFPVFDSYIHGIYQANVIQGEWVVRSKKNYAIPFLAKQGKNHRFTVLKKKPIANLSGKWEVTFGIDTDEPFKGIGEFTQQDNHITGTFMTETGDYRYLEGTVQDNKMYMSCFDGAHSFLFEAKIEADGTLIGSFRNGKHYKTIWEAKRNDKAKLADPMSLTFLKEGYDKLDFSFKNTDGQLVSISDEKYKGKVKLVQILGTWCPNCRDETKFLVDYLKKKNSPQLEVIALAFERHKDQSKALASIINYKKHFGINYEILLAGPSDKEEAAKKLPMLNKIISYPTLIFIDRNDKVRKIHTGFSGPATSQYQEFIKDFDNIINTLLSE